MRKLIILGLVIGLLFLSGCAAGIVGKIPQAGDSFSTVYIARKSGNIDSLPLLGVKVW